MAHTTALAISEVTTSMQPVGTLVAAEQVSHQLLVRVKVVVA